MCLAQLTELLLRVCFQAKTWVGHRLNLGIYTVLLLEDLRFEYKYEIEYKNNFSILVFRLHIILTQCH